MTLTRPITPRKHPKPALEPALQEQILPLIPAPAPAPAPAIDPASSPPRIATLAIEGRKAASAKENPLRLEWLKAALAAVTRTEARHLDAILLPGGFLALPPAAEDRLKNAAASELPSIVWQHLDGQLLRAFADASYLKNVPVIIGIDLETEDTPKAGPSREQLLFVYRRGRVETCVRKAFLVPADREAGHQSREEDINNPARILTLPSGRRAFLGVCYDLFGLYRQDPLRNHERGPAFFSDLIRDEMPELALGALHEFAQPGRDVFWQRHGIATASAAIGGGAAYGAAHYENSIAALTRPTAIPLAAAGVKKEHLASGCHRRAHSLTPHAARPVMHKKKMIGVLRLFP